MAAGMPISVLDIARKLVGAGLSVIPIGLDGTKRPAFDRLPHVPDDRDPARTKATWQPFQERLPNDEELLAWFSRSPAAIAVVAGAVSGGAECIDIDAPELIEPYKAQVAADMPELAPKLVWVETPSGGAHCWYRCAEIAGNDKLAWPQADAKPFKCLIETRGEGGYAVAPGSPLEAHTAGRPYRHVQGRLDRLKEISIEERSYLLRLARSFDRGGSARPHKNPNDGAELSPADDFDLRGPTFEELLAGTGAQLESGTWEDGRLIRPGKEHGYGATVGRCRGKSGEPLLHVFTTSWGDFPPGNYGRFHVLRILKHKGDGAAAMRECRRLGFGSAPSANGTGRQHVRVEESAPWGDPIPLDADADNPPAFPLEILPDGLARFADSIGVSLRCSPDYAAVSALSIGAGSIGGSFDLQVKRGYYENSNLFVCIVARKGSGKSPSIHPLAYPVYEEQYSRSSDQPAVFVDDVTTETLATIMQKSPRGLNMIAEEISGWMMGMDQYKAGGKGRDRQRYLSIWDGRPLKVDRKGKDSIPVFVPRPRLSVLGGIQPPVLESLQSGPDDGFFDRLLFCFPAESGLQPETWAEVPEEMENEWARVLRVLRSAEMVTEGNSKPRPKLIMLNESGRPVWQAWTEELAAASSDPEFVDRQHGATAKIRGYAARLALVIHLLREAYGEGVRRGVDQDDMRRGVVGAKYFMAHAERVYKRSGRDHRTRASKACLRWILSAGVNAFTRADAWASLRHNSLFSKPEDLVGPLEYLTISRYIRLASPSEGRGSRTGVYEVNPTIPRESKQSS